MAGAAPHPIEDPTRFGILPVDEQLHAVAPEIPFWNESVFLDWATPDGPAGHVRLGRMPGQARAWVWLFLRHDGEWIGIDEPRVPLALVDGFACDAFGLRARFDVDEPLARVRWSAAGVGRVLAGPRAGRLVQVEIDLAAVAEGPAHSVGGQVLAEAPVRITFDRFEQPVHVRGLQRVDGRAFEVDARGERDHSWGPRFWNMEWHFLAVHDAATSLQCAWVRFAHGGEVAVGYLQRDGAMRHLASVHFALAGDLDPACAPSGSVAVRDREGRALAGRLEPLGGCEIDASHAFSPPQRSLYRRHVVQLHPDGGGSPLIGWLEINRFPGGVIA